MLTGMTMSTSRADGNKRSVGQLRVRRLAPSIFHSAQLFSGQKLSQKFLIAARLGNATGQLPSKRWILGVSILGSQPHLKWPRTELPLRV